MTTVITTRKLWFGLGNLPRARRLVNSGDVNETLEGDCVGSDDTKNDEQ